ncbi:hypothetical protein GXY_15902 [Novacetimonas hansenii ATCC 23769]|uniref:Uncharacterized protein n=1 Tax=Novacetimonas hansenii ATCC 23769 TaxID=714995 RepID=D5QJ47_NOVHA|nr:hypothetical protein GXY_15902 [Novacetimonas hansenii ATCC 23769]
MPARRAYPDAGTAKIGGDMPYVSYMENGINIYWTIGSGCLTICAHKELSGVRPAGGRRDLMRETWFEIQMPIGR